MLPIIGIIVIVIAVFIFGKLIRPEFDFLSTILFWWLLINLFVAAFELLLFFNRKSLNDEFCRTNFWSSDVRSIWDVMYYMMLWNDYSCLADPRYMNADDFVHYIEFLNSILVFAMVTVVLLQKIDEDGVIVNMDFMFKALMILLFVQGANCVIYFISLYSHLRTRQFNDVNTPRGQLYLILSFMWIVFPFALGSVLLSVKNV